MLSLPRRFVYIYTKDGRKECVAMSDTLTLDEAVWFKGYYSKKDFTIESVTLEFDGRVLRKYEF